MRTTAVLLVLTLAGFARAAEKPNIIVIYADDMGYGDCTVNNPKSKISSSIAEARRRTRATSNGGHGGDSEFVPAEIEK